MMNKLQLQNLAWTSTSKSWPTLCWKSEQKLSFRTKRQLPNLLPTWSSASNCQVSADTPDPLNIMFWFHGYESVLGPRSTHQEVILPIYQVKVYSIFSGLNEIALINNFPYIMWLTKYRLFSCISPQVPLRREKESSLYMQNRNKILTLSLHLTRFWQPLPAVVR